MSTEFSVCDNVDLETLYLEFSSFYQVKFGKKPKFVKRIESSVQKMPAIVTSSSSDSKVSLSKRRLSTKNPDQPVAVNKNLESIGDSMRISSLTNNSSSNTTHDENNGNLSPLLPPKPMSLISDDEFFHCQPAEWKSLSEIIYKDIVRRDLCVKWDDIVGLDEAKQTLQESVIFPMKYPQLFRRIQPWKGQHMTDARCVCVVAGPLDKLTLIIDINLLCVFSAVLLHGVPGCGKTLLAKALCSEIHDGNFTFFNVAASTLISKWRGESEKLMRVLFDAAKFHAPSIIFIDELDSLTSRRTTREHEATKRLKNEFLSLLDGLDTQSDADENRKIFVLGSTNMPW